MVPLLLIALLTLASVPKMAPAASANGPTDAGQRELAIERSLACPQCTDLPLDVCDQDICADMRAIIHQKVSAGESDAQIRDFFVQRYGARVLLAPPKRSFDLLAWIVPFLGLALGVAMTAAFLRAARRRTPAPLPRSAMSLQLAGYRERVEREIEDLD